MTAEVPRTYGRYRLEERIGAGAIAEAFRAKSFGVEGFEKTLVIKRVLDALASDEAFIEAFVHEARLAMRLSHANVVQVFDLGRVEEPEGDSYYVAMEHVAGRDLDGMLEGWRGVGSEAPLGFGLYVASEIAKALDHAHRRRDEQLQSLGIVHGDLSARNVLLTWDGEVKLADFCVTRALYAAARDRLAEDERLCDKLASGSPELVRGEEAGPSSDVFALGSLLYEIIAGSHPFRAATQVETLRNVARARCRPLAELRRDLPAGLAELVHRALSSNPRERYASSAELHEELVALRYVSGLRFGADDVIELLETRRTEVALPGETVEALLERTQRELRPPEIRLPAPAPEEDDREPSALGPLAELKNDRELSVLTATFGATRAAKETLGHAEQMLTRYGGRLLRHTAADISAVFGLGAVDSLDTENAVRAGMVLTRSLSAAGVSVGVDVGRLGVDDDGALVEDDRLKALALSARRASTLQVGRVVVTAAAARNLRGQFELEPALGAAKSAKMPYTVGPRRTLEGASGAFIGRKSELRELGETLKRAGRRTSQVVGLTGSHGIGKTRLLHEATGRILRGSFAIACHVAACLPRGRELPLSAVQSMLRTLCGVREGDPPEIIAAIEPRLRALGLVDDEVDAVFGSLGLSRGEARPGLLAAALGRMFLSLADDRLHLFAWDDAHEIDDESGKLLASIGGRLANARVVLLFAGRPREDASFREIAGYRELSLGDLDSEDVRSLVATRLGVDVIPDALLEFVLERAGGHPMFVEELLREAVESGAVVIRDGKVARLALDGALAVPRPLRTLIVDRVRRLPDRERELLVAASVLGAPVDTAVLAAMLDLSIGTVNELADALANKLLVTRTDPVSLGFSTSLLPEIVLGELDVDARAELHMNAANAYPMVLGPRTEQEASRIAHHLAEAGHRSRAAGFYATSGFFHIDSRQLERATADFTRALELSDWQAQSPEELGEWIGALGRAVRHVRAGGELPDLVQRLWMFVQSSSGIAPTPRLRITVDLALILGALSRYKDAHRMLASAVKEAEPWPDLLQAALMVEAELAARQGEFKTALALLERVGGLGPLSAPEQHRRLLATAQAAGAAGEHERALEALDAAEALMPDGEPVLKLERAKVRGLIHGFRGDWARCAVECARAAEQARETGLLHEVAVHLHNQGDALMRIGELPRAYAVLSGSVSVCEQIGAERLLNLNRMMLAYLDALNGSEPARRSLGQGLARAEAQKWTWDALSGRTLLGRLLAKQGDTVGARRELMLARRLAKATSNQLVIDDCDRALAGLSRS